MSGVTDGIVIRDLASLEDYRACVALQDETWGDTFSQRVPPAILSVSQKIGGVAAGAFDAGGRMVGFVFGMTGVREGRLVHWSDMLAVREPFRGRHLGDALKRYQRQRVRALGVERMMWTYDPLVARNAHFNINRLGALPVEYVPDMYGSDTSSALHGSLPTDRFIVVWDLTREAPPPAAAELRPPGDEMLPLANPVDSGVRAGEPLEFGVPVPAPSEGAVRVHIPRDLQEEQRIGYQRAMRWRLSVRAAIIPLLAAGRRVHRFVRGTDAALPYYVFSPPGGGNTA